MQAFKEQLELVEEVNITPSPQAPTAGRRRPTRRGGTLGMDVYVADIEDAVVLLEQDGVFSWQLPSSRERFSLTEKQRKGRIVPPSGQRIHFEFEVKPDTPARRTAGPQEYRLGPIGDFALGYLRAFVLKFTARVVAGQAMSFLERNTHRGLVAIPSPEIETWHTIEDISQVHLPADRSPRLLLLIHGCFSSTVGSFGILGATEWGRSFVTAAVQNYDAVVGFDHATLSDDPLENAADLLRRCSLGSGKLAPTIDIVCFSRGGLVARSFVEQLLPEAVPPKANVGRIVFVAATHSGTRLAEPDNWNRLVDLYTNIVAGISSVVSLMPHAAGIPTIISGLLQSVGAFVKYLVSYAVADNVIPGLSAMEPGSDFVRTINELQTGERESRTDWYIISSDFEAKVFGDGHEPKEFPLRLAVNLAEGFVDQLMKAPNDLVVDSSSMLGTGVRTGAHIKDVYDFGTNSQVYHLAYFGRPEVCGALGEWLGLSAASEKPVAKVESPPLPTLVGPDVPQVVDTNISVVSAVDSAGSVRRQMRNSLYDYAVVTSESAELEPGGYYVYMAEDLGSRLEGVESRTSIADALKLDTEHSAVEVDLVEAEAGELRYGDRPQVVTDYETPIGVVAANTQIASSDSLGHGQIAGLGFMPRRTAGSGEGARAAPIRGKRRPIGSTGPRPKGGPRRIPQSDESESDLVKAYVRAEMPASVKVDDTATVACAVSRHDLKRWVRDIVTEAGYAEIFEEEPLALQIVPKANVEVVGEEIQHVQLPAAGQILQLEFQVRPTQAGKCEVWLEVRQDATVPLLTLRLMAKATARARRTQNYTAAHASVPTVGPDVGEIQLRIIEMERGLDTIFRYELSATTLGILTPHHDSKPIRDRASFVARMYQSIEERWLDTREDAESFEQELREYGGELFDELFPRDFQKILWDNRKRLRNVLIISEEPFIPWELIHLKRPGGALPKETIFLGQLGAVRWLRGGGGGGGYPPNCIYARPGRVLYLVPDYPHPEYALTDTRAEATFIEQHLGGTEVGKSANEVRRVLGGGKFDVLHFAGHGQASSANIGDSSILLAGYWRGRDYVPSYLTARTVRNQANFDRKCGPLIILNACQVGRLGHSLTSMGGFAEAFLARGASAFVSPLWAVGDAPARTFIEAFYRTLLAGKTVAEAVTAGRDKARRAGDATWLAYAVYANPRATLHT
ncbi:CHAT domain-containing protein [Streptomyces caniscabiei]|uniref:CHAT domain-containing protein n=1 Tax=Streptomyces caniscabiei TaxID=2746961 RepID=A0A927L0L7_9ACTN|nr:MULTISPECIES: TCAD7 domain-containing protein [Streptomyces]MBD9701999.1 CHAT domain-containing protein [Streptomyces caniscabiei]MBD9722838.1 CHAT domain-containing protein [Streptomyces caniscabiei]MBE4738907.1 CHAT domain-containing protein [Streptomyces caniscabiei]MBE4757953.1 CHAT domain-containing protein [Streptomyces caniscabiei]MBE4787614.1 CHAT domain-containing protein [Streptomyces caniscabiei]